MLRNSMFIVMIATVLSVPVVNAQSAFNPSASEIEESGFGFAAEPGEGAYFHGSRPTNTQYGQIQGPFLNPAPSGISRPTNAGKGGFSVPNLLPVVTAMPKPGTMTAAGSIALQNEGKTELPPTGTGILSDGALAADGAVTRILKPNLENVIGNEGAYLNGYGRQNTINTILPAGLTTGHPNAAPPLHPPSADF